VNIRRCTLALIIIFVISGCGSSATSTTHNPPSSSANAAAGSPSAAALPAPSPVDSVTEGIVCADLSALVIAGNSSDPISAVASVNHVTIGQVIYAINNRCPGLKSTESEIGQ
jgi:hypothetical protein